MHTKNASSKIKEDIRCAVENGSSSAFKKFSKNYQMYFFKKESRNSCKDQFQKTKTSLFDQGMLCWDKFIVMGTWVWLFQRSKYGYFNIVRGVVKTGWYAELTKTGQEPSWSYWIDPSERVNWTIWVP